MAALKAGIAYFAVVFAAGFALGTLRVTIVAPRVGETGALLLELPLILALSWVACAWLVRRHDVAAAAGPRLAMGAVAFALLMAAEAGLSTLVFGRSLAQHLAAYRTANGQLGLAAQLAFAAFPAAQAWLKRGKVA
jgi:hypothetical protein